MSSQIVSEANCGCRSTAQDCAPQQIPGPAGANGLPGTNGTDGQNAFTVTTASFVQPASSGTVNIEVLSSEWSTVGEPLFITTGGSYLVTAVPDATHITVQNLGYAGNASPTTVIASSSVVTPSGFKGDPGASSSGDMLRANNLSDVVSVGTSRSNLGLGALAVLNTVNNGQWSGTDLSVGNGGTGASLAATALSNLGGQPLNALLTQFAALVPAPNEMFYLDGISDLAVLFTTAYGRGALADTDAVTARSRLGKLLPRYGCLGSLTGVDMNLATNDNPMTIESARYRIDKITFENASISLTTATVGVFTAAGGGGTSLAADQALSALTATSKFKDLTLGGSVATDVVTTGTIQIRTGTAQGAPAIADCFVFGWKYD